MALRKYNAVRGGESATHTSDGFIIPKGQNGGIGGGSRMVLPPPDYPWIGIGSYYVGPITFAGVSVGGGASSVFSLRINLDDAIYTPMFEGME